MCCRKLRKKTRKRRNGNKREVTDGIGRILPDPLCLVLIMACPAPCTALMGGTRKLFTPGAAIKVNPDFNHGKFSDLLVDLKYFSFSYPNSTHLAKHEFVSPNNQFYQRMWHEEYYSVHAYMVWIQKFRLAEISLGTGRGVEPWSDCHGCFRSRFGIHA